MDIDLDKIFKDDEKLNKKIRRTKADSALIPGTLFLFSFAIPVFIIYVMALSPVLMFFSENNLVWANIILYVFFILALTVVIISEFRQPFSTVSVRQSKKGRMVRNLVQLTVMFYVIIILFSMALLLNNFHKYSFDYNNYLGIKDLFWFLF